jgi:hypothetical protein
MKRFRDAFIRRPSWILVMLLGSAQAWSYMDPGTSASVYALAAPILSFIALCAGFLIKPIKRFWTSYKARRVMKRPS